jgi:hypothetical protein
MRSLEQPLLSNMFRLQMWLQFRQVSTMITLCSVAHFADRHRDASRRHHPTPATLFLEACDCRVLQCGPARVLVTNRHRGALHSTQQTEKRKATNFTR